MRTLRYAFVLVLALLALLLAGVRARYGGGEDFPYGLAKALAEKQEMETHADLR